MIGHHSYAVVALAASLAVTSILSDPPVARDVSPPSSHVIELSPGPLPAVSVFGDSLTVPAASELSMMAGDVARVTVRSFPGTDLSSWAGQVRASMSSRLVLALGTNDAAGKGAGPWRDLLASLPPSTCVVWPRTFPSSSRVASFDATMDSLIVRFPNVRVIDWASRVTARPDWLLPDGMHYTSAGTSAYAVMLLEAVRACAGSQP